jgi:hypothetical protein
LAGHVGNSLQSLDPIFEGSMGPSPDIPMPPGIDKIKIADLAVTLGVRGTDATRTVLFCFGADREEGVLLRVIFRPAERPSVVDGTRPCRPVHWFNLQQLPEAEELRPVIEDALAEMIDDL